MQPTLSTARLPAFGAVSRFVHQAPQLPGAGTSRTTDRTLGPARSTASGRPRAARLLGSAESLVSTGNQALTEYEKLALEAARAATQAGLGADPYVASHAEGEAMPIDEAVSYAFDTYMFASPRGVYAAEYARGFVISLLARATSHDRS